MTEALEKAHIGASPWMQRINAVHTAVEAHDKAGRKWSGGQNKTASAVLFHATELADLIDEITAGKRDSLGYEEDEEAEFLTEAQFDPLSGDALDLVTKLDDPEEEPVEEVGGPSRDVSGYARDVQARWLKGAAGDLGIFLRNEQTATPVLTQHEDTEIMNMRSRLGRLAKSLE